METGHEKITFLHRTATSKEIHNSYELLITYTVNKKSPIPLDVAIQINTYTITKRLRSDAQTYILICYLRMKRYGYVPTLTHPNILDRTGRTLLHQISRSHDKSKGYGGIEELLNVLICRGVNVNYADNMKETPLHVAVRYQQTEIIKILLIFGANPNLINYFNETALDIVGRLTASDETKVAIGKMLLRRGMSLTGKRAHPILRRAIERGNINFLNLVLSYSERLEELDEDGNTCLHDILSYRKEDAEFLKVVKLLISKGCAGVKNSKGETPLSLTIKYNLHIVSHMLLKFGVDITEDVLRARDYEGCNLLHLLSSHSNSYSDSYVKNVVELFMIRKPTTINSLNNIKYTPLMVAVESDNCKMARLLLDHGADVDYEKSIYVNSLYLVRSRQMIELLFDYGAKHRTMLEIYLFIPKASKLFERQVLKLKIANIRFDLLNERAGLANRNSFMVRNYRTEYEELKSIKISSQVSLVDIFCMSDNQRSIYSNNIDIKRIIDDERFATRFPHYSKLIKAYIRKGNFRSHLLRAARQSLENLTGITLPDICFEIITSVLENKDLEKLTEANLA